MIATALVIATALLSRPRIRCTVCLGPPATLMPSPRYRAITTRSRRHVEFELPIPLLAHPVGNPDHDSGGGRPVRAFEGADRLHGRACGGRAAAPIPDVRGLG